MKECALADCFDGIPIWKHTGQGRGDVTYIRTKYGDSPQFRTSGGWKLTEAWEQSQAMSCGVTLYDEDGERLPNFPVLIGWFDTVIETKTNSEGWVDVPIAGSQYVRPNKAGFFIKAKDGSWTYDGIGYVIGTNHDVYNLRIQRGGRIPPPVVPTPGGPYVGMNRQDALALRALMVASREKADEAVGALDRYLEGTP